MLKSVSVAIAIFLVVVFTACGGGGSNSDSSFSSSSNSSSQAIDSAPVLKTGQTIVYRDGDDGTYQAGVARSYSRDDANGIITDNATGLEWQDDAVGDTMDWSEAVEYCRNLSLDGGDWRLPAVEELVGITDKSRTDPSIDPLFQYVTPDDYWSSTTYASNSTRAWYVYFRNGVDDWNNKTRSHYVRCVRSGQ